MHTLFIINDPPYGTERTYTGLRLAASMVTREAERVSVFLMGDATASAKAGQEVPRGSYSIEGLLRLLLGHGGRVAACGTCIEARGISAGELVAGVTKSTLQELTDWVQTADRTMVF